MNFFKLLSVFLLLLFTMRAGSCTATTTNGAGSTVDTSTATTPATDAISVNFNLKLGHTAGATVATCNSVLSGLGTTAVNAQLHDARFYVHDVTLIDDAGTSVPLTLDQDQNQYANVAIVDFEDGTGPTGAATTEGCGGNTPWTHTSVTGNVPKGHTFVGVSFKVGVPDTGTLPDGTVVNLNHTATDAVPAPLNLSSMAWSWQAGRKFMKFELNPYNSGTTNFQNGITRLTNAASVYSSSWFFHLGATGCTGNANDGSAVSCTNPNIFSVKFASGFNPASNSITLDLQSLFSASDITTDAGGAYGCMSGPTDIECTDATATVAGTERTALAAAGQTWNSLAPGFAFTNGTKIFGQIGVNITDGLQADPTGLTSNIFFVE